MKKHLVDKATLFRWMTKGMALVFVCTASYDFFSVAMSNEEQVKKENLPGCLRELVQASSFDDGVRGESPTVSANFKAYQEASDMIAALKLEDLYFVLEHGTPAAKLYAAVLLKQSGRVGNNLSFDKLLHDDSKITYLSGCRGTSTTVKEVAQSFIDTGSFLNFKFSLFCKLKSPVAAAASSPASHATPETNSGPGTHSAPETNSASGTHATPETNSASETHSAPGTHSASSTHSALSKSSNMDPASPNSSLIHYASSAALSAPAKAAPTKAEISAALLALTNSSVLQHFQQGDSNKPASDWLAFQVLLRAGSAAKSDALSLCSARSPSARIYGAILINEIDKKESQSRIKGLLNDRARVLVSEGCSRYESTVAELAQKVLDGDQIVILRDPRSPRAY